VAPFCAVLPWLGGGVKWAAKMEPHADPGLRRPVQVPSNAHCRMMLHPACTAAHPCNATQLPQGLFAIAQRDIRIIPEAVLVAFRCGWVVVVVNCRAVLPRDCVGLWGRHVVWCTGMVCCCCLVLSQARIP